MISNRQLQTVEILPQKVEFQANSEDKKIVKEQYAKHVFPRLQLVHEDPLDALMRDPNYPNYHSDVWLITQSDRLAALSAENLNQIIATRFTPRKEPSKSGVSDEVLFDAIVSRHVDSPAEKLRYLKYLESQIDAKSDELEKFVEKSVDEVAHQGASSSENSSDNTKVQ